MSLPDDPAERHRAVAGRFTTLVLATTDWDAPSPVREWQARDVVGHLAGWLPGLLDSGAGIRLRPGPSAEDDPAGAWQVLSTQVQEVLDDAVAGARLLTNPYLGELPVAEAVDRFYTSDVFLHSWDLARAGGLDDRLDPEVCADLLAGMEPLADVLYASGQYGPPVAVPADAGVQDRLLGLIGRDPAWRPPAPPGSVGR
ncbi:maleylpyruvate isomerase family mycothiol-dependent enzyme [Nakamurella endophytica]|uniref:Mycothiol-dependent maleylpyruvate isomerase metal-binding domain-containing protein n=1 Tax=Nakamurella endophytica TaxID=1748367 RepID=A0A917WBW3_9ACTN|nr:maleylpyruvate isomerase family mycothiol-dependent enzyme [Nakamurella endophytica]GGL92696.1 hypothetical protein GCM10011594_10600 [Nakamurella endophytica]